MQWAMTGRLPFPRVTIRHWFKTTVQECSSDASGNTILGYRKETALQGAL